MIDNDFTIRNLYVTIDRSEAMIPRMIAPHGLIIRADTDPTAIPPVIVAFCRWSCCMVILIEKKMYTFFFKEIHFSDSSAF